MEFVLVRWLACTIELTRTSAEKLTSSKQRSSLALSLSLSLRLLVLTLASFSSCRRRISFSAKTDTSQQVAKTRALRPLANTDRQTDGPTGGRQRHRPPKSPPACFAKSIQASLLAQATAWSTPLVLQAPQRLSATPVGLSGGPGKGKAARE